jgi:uncharacterized protein (TIGR03435 family)
MRRSAKLRTYLLLATVVSGTLTASSVTYAQEPSQPSFEVATVRPSGSTRPQLSSVKSLPNRFEISAMTLKDVMAIAYNLGDADQQIVGGAGWIRSERFDIVAKEDEAVSARMRKLAPEQQGNVTRLMMQRLLADRFGLKVHSETRALSTYSLALASGGPKLKKAVSDPHLPENIPASRINVMGQGWLEGHGCDMTLLTKMLGSRPEVDGRTVVDKTGLPGKYDFTLKWTPDSATDAGSATGPESLPSFFTALQEQLGLRLVSAKEQVEVIVVDDVDKPSEN